MSLDAGEVAGEAMIRTTIAAALVQNDEANGHRSEWLFALAQAEAVTNALAESGYEIRRTR